jgi:hypothetical protein
MDDIDFSVFFDDDGNLMPGALDGFGGFPGMDDDGGIMPGLPRFDDDGNAMPGLGGGGDGGGGLPGLPRLPGMPGGGGGGTSGLNDILRMFGMGGSGGGMGGLAGLIPLIAALYGGTQARNAAGDSAARIEQAATDASAQTRDILGNAGAAYKPFADAGAGALARMTGAADSNIAAKFAGAAPKSAVMPGGPIGQASNLAGGFRPIGQASNMGAGFRPLGSGRSLRQIGGR